MLQILIWFIITSSCITTTYRPIQNHALKGIPEESFSEDFGKTFEKYFNKAGVGK